MATTNVKNPEDRDKYKKLFFSDKGYDVLINYLKNLINEYLTREDYPYQLSAVLAIPLFKYALEIKSEQELLGRIKLLGQILGIEEVNFTAPNGKNVSFNMNGEFIIT